MLVKLHNTNKRALACSLRFVAVHTAMIWLLVIHQIKHFMYNLNFLFLCFFAVFLSYDLYFIAIFQACVG